MTEKEAKGQLEKMQNLARAAQGLNVQLGLKGMGTKELVG